MLTMLMERNLDAIIGQCGRVSIALGCIGASDRSSIVRILSTKILRLLHVRSLIDGHAVKWTRHGMDSHTA